jgi:MFS family permease
MLGLMAASYPLGAILSTPFSAPIADTFGRRWSIFIGMRYDGDRRNGADGVI